MFRVTSTAFCLLFFTVGVTAADTDSDSAVFSSGEQQVVLIELFTSEGCSSCPPADHWLSGLKADPDLWKRFVPVAFHVDYWDYIGWKDRFARPEYSGRQRQYAADGGARFVYTPGFFSQGKEWQGWRNGKSVARDGISVGDLTVRVDGEDIAIQFDALNPDGRHVEVHLAVLGMGLETAVRAGENKGRKLSHDFVVLEAWSSDLNRSGSLFTAATRLPETYSGAASLALAVWVSEDGKQTPIQSVGGFLPGS